MIKLFKILYVFWLDLIKLCCLFVELTITIRSQPCYLEVDNINSPSLELFEQPFFASEGAIKILVLKCRVRVRSPIRNPTMDVAGFPNRFCILLDFHVWVGLATTGHIRSLMISSVHVISFVFLLSKYTNSIKVSNQKFYKTILCLK